MRTTISIFLLMALSTMAQAQAVSMAPVMYSYDGRNTSGLHIRTVETVMPYAIESFYHADWRQTQKLLNELKQIDGENLLPYFFSSMIPFWEYFFGGADPKKADEFLKLSAIAIELGEKQLKAVPQDTSAILLLSGLHGYRSLVAAQEKRYRVAMSSGITGYSYTRTLMSMDNDDPNTLMGQGVFHYMVGSIPSEIRWMARLAGMSGDKNEGLHLLEQAASANSHVSNDARMFLVYLYEREGELTKSIHHLNALIAKYPGNPIFHYNLGRMHELNGSNELAISSYNTVLKSSLPDLRQLRVLSNERIADLSGK